MKVFLTSRAKKDLEVIRKGRGPAIANVLLGRLMRLEEGFEGVDIKKLEGSRLKLYRVRFGLYRVMLEWQGEELRVLEVSDRKDAY